MDLNIVIPIVCIFFIGSIFKGVMGFGLPIIVMSLLPFFVPIETAIVISAFVQPFTNINQLVSAGGYARAFKVSWPIILFLIPGTLIGSWFVTSLDSSVILLIVGGTIIGFAMIELLGFRLAITEELRKPIGFGFGFVAGVSGALTSLNGWAFILYLMGLGVDRQNFRSALALLFLISGSLISAGFWVVGWLTWELFLYGIAAVPPAFLGMRVGNKLGEKIPAENFRNYVLIALLIIGGSIVYSSFG